MKTSESIKNISIALLKAQKSMGGAVKDSKNPYFKSNYADYGSVLEASKNPLNDNGILVLQPHVNRDSKNFVETLLVDASSGEWMLSETEVVCAKQNDPQALGSAITYARRYGLQSFLAMPTADDDGEAAMYRTGKTELTKTVANKTEVPFKTTSAVKPADVPKLAPENTTTAPTTSVAASEPVKKPSFKDRMKTTPVAPSTMSNGSVKNGGF